MTRVAIIGASIGGLIAAAALRERGIEVTLIERSNSIGGLYGKVNTPFGIQELGMHVLYAGNEQFRHLMNIFGANAFHVLEDLAVDIGGCYNFGCLFLDSIYPDVRNHPAHGIIFDQMVKSTGGAPPANADEAVVQRFGEEAGRGIVAPILQKLWKAPTTDLSPAAIHCFFDLRRIILCDKEIADELKKDPRLDAVIGNPVQSRPSGQVFGGRRGLFFKGTENPFAERVEAWLRSQGIVLEFNSKVAINDRRILVNGVPVSEFADGCIVATPVTSLAPDINGSLDQLELSIFYVRLAKSIVDAVPTYYILCHAPALTSARIVNYDCYHPDGGVDRRGILAVEALHPVGLAPTQEHIARELLAVLPSAAIEDVYRLPKSLQLAIPSLRNGRTIDRVIVGLESPFKEEALFFTGMRTDRGVFFSHHTMGAAHDAVLECARRLS
jgi:hypothetical protein